MKVLRIMAFLAVLSLSFGSVLPAPVQAKPPAPDLIQKLKDQTGGSVRIDYHTQTGKVNFIGADRSASIAVTGINSAATTEGVSLGFLNEYGSLFGVSDPAKELTVMKTRTTEQGDGMIRYQQVYRGVPVMGAELTLITDGGNILSASGEFLPNLALDVTPTIDAAAAQSEARALVNKFYSLPLEDLTVSEPYLTIYDPAILGGPGIRRATLAWRMEVSTVDLSPVRELVLVDAANGSIALHFNQIDTALYRKVYDKANVRNDLLPGSEPPTRIEGGGASGITDVDYAYEFAGETYNYFFNNEGRDSIDGAGMQLISTTRFCYTSLSTSCPYANAFWNGSQMVYGAGYASADDVVGHEMTHGVTENESGLFYYYQSGAINESLSDIFGEFVDLSYDYRVTDTPANKWLLGEDLSIGAIRDMENPPAYSDPDKISSANYNCDLGFADNGGVHTNSGIANKAAFLMTDGGTFNGQTITGIGMTKASKIWYYLNANLLNSAGDFKDLYNLLPQACTTLIGTVGITASDCTQVSKAVVATEMNLQPTGGCAIPAEPTPCSGQTPAVLWSDNFDRSPLTGWAVGNFTGGNHWYQGIDYATTNPYSLWGDDYTSTGNYYIYMTSGVTLTAGQVYYLTFNHAWEFDFYGTTYYDGGILEYSTNGGVSWNSATSLFSDNPPNRTLAAGNPLAGTAAFAGMSFGYTTSKLNLGTLTGQTVRFRFRIGTDSSIGYYGWFIDDMKIFSCGTPGITVTPTSGLTVTEAAGAGHTATFTVKLNTPPSANVSIGLSSSDTSEGTVSPASLTFTSANYSTPQTVTITGVADSMYDTDKAFSIITAAATSTDPNYNGLNASDVSVTCLNSDPPPQISFSSATYSVGEAGGSSTITVSISGAREGSMGVTYATSNGTATAGSDYTTASGTLVFAPADSSKTFAVTIINDTVYEGNETVNLALSSPTGGAVLGSTTAATLTITDDDTAPVISLSSATYTIGEAGGSLTVTVNAVGAHQYPVGVSYAASDGSATAGSDYTAASGTLSFASGETSKTFDIAITNDTVYEGSETFNITLGSPTGGATLGTPNTAVATITDNDAAPVISLNSATYSVGEAGGSLTVTVNAVGAHQYPVGVSYAASDGSATAGSDYTAASGTLSFASGETSKTFDIAITNDTVYEGSETFNITLGSPTGGATLGTPNTAVATITDNDAAPVISLNSATYSVGEAGGSLTVTVNAVGAHQYPVGVSYAASDGSATAGSDYTAASGTLSFASGETSKTFDIAITNDTVYEGSETFNITLGSPTGGATLGTPNTAVATITDNDAAPVISLNSATYSVGEAGGSLTVTVNAVGAHQYPVGVSYAASDGSATAGSDYTATSGVLSFASGETSKTFDIAITNDTVYEGSETFNIALSTPTGGATLGTPSAAEATITDNDTAPVITLDESTYAVTEDGVSLTVTVNVTGDHQYPVGVSYDTSDGSATAGSDYTAASGALSFASGETSKTFDIPITDDTIYEGSETFNIALSSPTGGATLGTPNSAVATITDNDAAPVITLDESTYTVTEDGVSLTVTVNVTGDHQYPVGVSYDTSDGTATAGSDYTATSGVLSFASGETSKTFDIAITNDTVYEGSETFNIALSTPTGGATLGTPSAAEATITDNDAPPVITLDESTYTIGEAGGSLTVTVNVTGDHQYPVGVSYDTSDGTATAGSDYTAASSMLSFASGETSKTFDIPITDDTVYEGSETFNIALSTPTGGATLGTPSAAEATITDNDTAPVITLDESTYAVTEDGVSLTVTVNVTGDHQYPVGVSYDTSDGTATAGSDYTAASSMLSFASGETSKTFDIAITDDTVYEGSETFNIALSTPTGGATLGTPNSAVATITDNDAAPVITLDESTYTVTEDGVSLTVTVNVTGDHQYPVGVSYATSDGTATAGSDYTAASSMLSFASGETSKTFDIPITDDTIYEGSETFNIALSSPTGSATLGTPNSAVATITDNDAAPVITLDESTYTVTEDGVSLTVTVNVTGDHQYPVGVSYDTSDGSATAGSDFTAASGVLSFASGETSKTFDIAITNDTVYEGSETFNIALGSPTGGATLGTPNTAVVTITDNDAPPVITFSAATYPVGEGDGSVTVTVNISGERQYNASVNYATADGTALDGIDYAAVSGTLTFTPTDTSQTINIAILDDSLYSLDETFGVSLSDPLDASLGTPSSAVVTIINHNAELSIAKTGSPNPVRVGSRLTYTLTITNNGADDALDVVVTDTLPAGVSYQSFSGSGWDCVEASGTVTCTLASLAGSGSSELTLVVTAPLTPGDITNTASVTSGIDDSDLTNNTASVDTEVRWHAIFMPMMFVP